ncbi:hypothetical protein MXB_3108, partial [Myxobolus squamalis]
NKFSFLSSTRGSENPYQPLQGKLAILRLVHIPGYAWVGTLICLSFQGSVGVKPTNKTHYLLKLAMPNFKDIGFTMSFINNFVLNFNLKILRIPCLISELKNIYGIWM